MTRRIKILALILVAFLLIVYGCSKAKEPAEQKPAMSEEEITQMYSNPDFFKGRQIEFTGQVFGSIQQNKDIITFQMHADPEEREKNTVVYYDDPNLNLKADAYIKVFGAVRGKFEGKNMLGGSVTCPSIQADYIEIKDYISVVSPNIAVYDAKFTRSQYGYWVTLQKIEFAKKETRVYLSVKNDGKSNFSLYSFNAKIVQNGKQYEEQTNFDADYPEIQSDLMPGIITEGIITFPALEQINLKLVLKGHSDNWNEKINDYIFDLSFK